jgi:two-component system sensor histidine kinase SenX3
MASSSSATKPPSASATDGTVTPSPKSDQRLLTRARQGQSGERELQLFGPPREVLFLRSQPLLANGAILGAVVFIRDISETRRRESVRRDFVANVSHELKTPIGALALLAETMAAGGDEHVVRQLAERVSREADRLGRIIDDLLNLSLIEAQESPTREPLPIAVLINEAVEAVRPAAEALGIPLHVSTYMPDVAVPCDRRQVLSALTNLLDNAIKYSEAPSVEISVGSGRDGHHHRGRPRPGPVA